MVGGPGAGGGTSIYCMVKRLASATLWFIATGWAFNYLSAFIGMPSILGLVLSGAVAAFVGFDPLHVVWPVRDDARTRRTVRVDIAQRAAHSKI